MESNGVSVRCASVFVLFSILFLGGVCGASAQVSTGTMLGVVKDVSGAVIAGVTITARNTETNLTRTFVTGDDGAYRIPSLPSGSYELRAEHEGFQTQVQTGLTLTVSQEEAVNFTLQIGSTQQTVSVTGEATLVDTSSSAVGGTVNPETLADLPLNGRSFVDLTMLQPGVSDNKNQNNANRGSSGHYFSSNGAQVRSNNYYLDGTSLVNPYGASSSSIAQTTLGVDGIQEYRVITSGIPAELGMVMGSQMLIVSKGGTNGFHGSAFEFLRNSVFDARNFFDTCPVGEPTCRRIPEFQRNDYGATFGGPIRKDKTFFFLSYEGLREQKGITTVTNDLPAAVDANGNTIAGGACRGAAGAVLTSGTGVGQCANLLPLPTGSTVTVASIMAPFLSTTLYPLPNLPGNRLTFPYTQPTIENYGQARLDHTFSSKDSVFARFTADYATQDQVQPYPEYKAGLNTVGEWVTLGENHIFSPALLNSLRVSFSRSDIGETTDITPGFNASSYINSALSIVTGYPTGGVSATGTSFTGAAAASGPLVRQQNIFAYQDDLNYSHGKHSLKFGFLINHYLQYATADASIKGTVGFTNFANYVAGYYQTLGANLANSNLARSINYTTIGVYGQDDLRLTSRFTLNLGLRYEFLTMPFERFGQWSAFIHPLTDPGTINGVVAMPPTPGGRLFANNPSVKNFGPRFGFAWDVMGDGKTSVRGAYDLLYDIGDYESITLQTTAGQPPISERGSVNLPSNGYVVVGGVLTLPPGSQPLVLTLPFGPATFPPGAVNSAPRPMDYYFKQPYLHLYNLTVDRQLPWSSVVTISYVGSRGIHLPDDVDGNPEVPSGVPGAGGACVARPAGQAANYASVVSGSATACFMSGDPRLNTAWGSWTDTYTTRGDSWYNSLQVGFTKRMTQGLQVQASYTYGHSIDNNPGQLNPDQNGTGILNGVDPINMNTDRGSSATDLPHNFKFNAVYYFPRVGVQNAFAKATLNGWWVSGIFTSLSGFPFTPTLGQNRSRSGTDNGAAGLDRPNWLSGFADKDITTGTSAGCGSGATRDSGGSAIKPGSALGTPALWFDPCAFTLQPAGFLGNAGRNRIRGPDFRNLDFSIVKDTGMKMLGESGKLQFRAEIFNVLNHANFALPGRQVLNGAVTDATGVTTINPVGSAGTILSTVGSSRQIQFALKVLF
jgi:hypothetical protein